MAGIIRGQLQVLSKIPSLVNLIGLTYSQSQRFGESGFGAIARLIYLLSVGKFSPKEILAYAPQYRRNAVNYPIIISKEASLKTLGKINDAGLADLTEDKHVFYGICEKEGISIPRHIFTTQSEDSRYDEMRSLSSDQFMHCIPGNIITKDRAGAYGSGFAAYEKKANKLLSNSGAFFSVDSLFEMFEADTAPPLIVQERMFDHPELASLSGTNALQCLRLVTYLENNGSVRFLFFIVKLLARGNIVDNFSGGTSGNLIAYGDIENGVLQEAVGGTGRPFELMPVEVHPESGRSIKGFKIPLWNEACSLAENAHKIFDQFRTIGWDIAITTDGPKILEGNIWYDPPLYAPQIMSEGDWSLIFGS